MEEEVEDIREERAEGKLELIISLIKSGDISINTRANKLGMTEEELKEKMAE